MSSPLESRGLSVMGRVPHPGRVKTRLTTRWTPEEAAMLYEAFLKDVFALVDRAHAKLSFRRVFSCALAVSEALELAQNLVPSGWTVVKQEGTELGDRIEYSRTACGADHVVVLGSDAPCMSPKRILTAFARLDQDQTDLVMGPTVDGGYDLIGFRGARAEILRDIPWSTSEVAEATRKRAQEHGYSLEELDLGYDVDRPEDLDRAILEVHDSKNLMFYTQRVLSERLSGNVYSSA